MTSPKWKLFQTELVKRLSVNMAKVNSLLSENEFDHLFIQSALFGNSALVYSVAKRLGRHVVTHDGGYNIALTGVDSIAGHCMDISKMFELKIFEGKNPLFKERALELAKKEFAQRMSGTDVHSYQKVSYDGGRVEGPYDILIPLNIDYDSAALGKSSFFQHQFHWLTETLRFIIENTKATVVVRQHPYERKAGFDCQHDLKAELARLFPGTTRLLFVAAADDVNTYKLLHNVKIVLPFTTSIGVEAAILGKYVVMESGAYYSEFSFVEKGRTKDDYFQKIKASLERTEPLSDKKIEDAWLCYYAAQIANRIPTGLTAVPAEFRLWAKNGFPALLKDANTQSIITSFIERVPAVVWRTKELVQCVSVPSQIS